MMTLWSWISSLQSCEKIPSLVGLAAQSVVLHFGSPNKHIYLWYLWSRHQRKLNLDSKHRCFESKFQITSSLPPTMHTYTHSHTHTHGDMHYSWTHMHLASLKGRMYLIAHKLTLPSPPSAFIFLLPWWCLEGKGKRRGEGWANTINELYHMLPFYLHL